MAILRRDILSFLPMAMATGLALPDFMNGSVPDGQSSVLPSAIFPFDSLEVHASATAQVRPILKGKLATGESIEVHETTLPPGGAPHPAHHHEHTEMWLVREGTVELTIEGKSHRLSGGSLGYVRSNEEHGITNPSDKSATYFVVAVGPGSDK